jgi:hypothetical protein
MRLRVRNQTTAAVIHPFVSIFYCPYTSRYGLNIVWLAQIRGHEGTRFLSSVKHFVLAYVVSIAGSDRAKYDA